MQQSFKFNKKIFNMGYAYQYTILQYIFLPGYIFVILALILPAHTFTIPDAMLPILSLYLPAAFIGFPLMLLFKIGHKRNLSESRLYFDGDGVLIFDETSDKIPGLTIEKHCYKIYEIKTVKIKRQFYELYGRVEKIIVNNGHVIDAKNVNMVKIPNAYSGLENIKDILIDHVIIEDLNDEN